jgi:hypothetical protein
VGRVNFDQLARLAGTMEQWNEHLRGERMEELRLTRDVDVYSEQYASSRG